MENNQDPIKGRIGQNIKAMDKSYNIPGLPIVAHTITRDIPDNLNEDDAKILWQADGSLVIYFQTKLQRITNTIAITIGSDDTYTIKHQKSTISDKGGRMSLKKEEYQWSQAGIMVKGDITEHIQGQGCKTILLRNTALTGVRCDIRGGEIIKSHCYPIAKDGEVGYCDLRNTADGRVKQMTQTEYEKALTYSDNPNISANLNAAVLTATKILENCGCMPIITLDCSNMIKRDNRPYKIGKDTKDNRLYCMHNSEKLYGRKIKLYRGEDEEKKTYILARRFFPDFQDRLNKSVRDYLEEIQFGSIKPQANRYRICGNRQNSKRNDGPTM